MEYWAEICACGHAVKHHALLGTDYCRCESYPGECPCSGGARVAVLVLEEAEKVSGTQTNTRFFKRQFHAGSEHPLNAGIRKARSGDGVSLEWAVSECDLCGNEWEIGEDFVAFWSDSEGEPQMVGEMHEVTGRTLLLCGLCCVELEWKHGNAE